MSDPAKCLQVANNTPPDPPGTAPGTNLPAAIAYWKPGAVRTKVVPASGSWAAGVDRTVEKISGWARWVVAGKGKGPEPQLWTVSDGNGFQILRFTENFKAQHKDLFQDADE